MGIAARVLMLLSAGLLALSYVSMLVNPAKAWYFTFFGLLFIPFILLNVIMLIWAICRKSRTFIIPLLALLPGLLFIGRYFRFASGGAGKGDDCIKIMTYNVGKFSLGKGYEYSGSLDSITALVRRTNADIVCLQEFSSEHLNDVPKLLEAQFPDYFSCYYINMNAGGGSGNVTLSRFPIESRGHLDFEESANLAIYTDIRIGERRIRIYNCHFQSYSISLAALARNWKHRSVMRETEHKMKASIIKRPRQVEQVLSDIEDCPLESSVLGDFNDTPEKPVFRPLTAPSPEALFVNLAGPLARRGSGSIRFEGRWELIDMFFVRPSLAPDAVMDILHRELGIPYEEITQSGGKSYIVLEKTKDGADENGTV